LKKKKKLKIQVHFIHNFNQIPCHLLRIAAVAGVAVAVEAQVEVLEL